MSQRVFSPNSNRHAPSFYTGHAIFVSMLFIATIYAVYTGDLEGPFLYRALKAMRGTGECVSPDFM
jgi:hypothetical protein